MNTETGPAIFVGFTDMEGRNRIHREERTQAVMPSPSCQVWEGGDTITDFPRHKPHHPGLKASLTASEDLWTDTLCAVVILFKCD